MIHIGDPDPPPPPASANGLDGLLASPVFAWLAVVGRAVSFGTLADPRKSMILGAVVVTILVSRAARNFRMP